MPAPEGGARTEVWAGRCVACAIELNPSIQEGSAQCRSPKVANATVRAPTWLSAIATEPLYWEQVQVFYHTEVGTARPCERRPPRKGAGRDCKGGAYCPCGAQCQTAKEQPPPQAHS